MSLGQFRVSSGKLRRLSFFLAAALLLSLLPAGSAFADQLLPYSFTGTLASPVNGSTSVTGTFLWDQNFPGITQWNITTPAGVFTSTDPIQGVDTNLFAPGDNLIQFNFFGENSTFLVLNFATSADPFNPGNLLTTPIMPDPNQPASVSHLGCFGNAQCGVPETDFASGSATFTGHVPEPSSVSLLLLALVALAFARFSRLTVGARSA